MASNDTYAGSLEVLAKQLASMSLLADANLPFVMGMLDQVQAEMRSPEMAMQKAGVLPPNPAGPDVGMGMPMAAPPPSMGPPGITPDGIAAALGGLPPGPPPGL
jgi:hypothetical protein